MDFFQNSPLEFYIVYKMGTTDTANDRRLKRHYH